MPSPGTAWRFFSICVLAGSACLPAPAQETVYRCTGADGRTAYRDAPCEDGKDKERLVRLHVPPPSAPASAPRWDLSAKPAARAVFTLFYDPKDEPMEHPTAVVESAIRHAMNAWMAGCKVELVYGGRGPYQADGTPDRVGVRWQVDYLRAIRNGAGVAGTGSLRTGIQLNPRMTNLKSVMTHELGHVLGLPHTHEHADSIMSYLRDESVRKNAQPSAGDYLACNLSMKKQFGIAFDPGPDAAPAPTPAGPRMSDSEAVKKNRAERERKWQEEQRRLSSGGR